MMALRKNLILRDAAGESRERVSKDAVPGLSLIGETGMVGARL